MLSCIILCCACVQSGCERAQLMAWHSGPLLLLLLLECNTPAAAAAAAPLGPPSLPVSTPASSAADTGSSSTSSSSHTTAASQTAAAAASATAATAASLLKLLCGPGHALAGQLAGELPAKHLWHVQGLRYLYQDHLAAAMR
jgi:hypothetical protein